MNIWDWWTGEYTSNRREVDLASQTDKVFNELGLDKYTPCTNTTVYTTKYTYKYNTNKIRDPARPYHCLS